MTIDVEPIGGHSAFELIESHGNILRHSKADFAAATAKCVTENAEVVCPYAVSVDAQMNVHEAATSIRRWLS